MLSTRRPSKAIQLAAKFTVALVAAYWCGTDRVGWIGLILCGVVVAICGIADYINELSTPEKGGRSVEGEGNRTNH